MRRWIFMQEDVSMSFSGILGPDKRVAVSFSSGERYAEGELPSCLIKKNKGFSEEEAAGLSEYLKNNKDYIYSKAKKINPLRAFMGEGLKGGTERRNK